VLVSHESFIGVATDVLDDLEQTLQVFVLVCRGS